MTTIRCPNCKSKQKSENNFDQNYSELITCKHCSFTVAKFCWDPVFNVNELNLQSIRAKRLKDENRKR